MTVSYSTAEQIADRAGHALGIVASIAGLVVLILVGSQFPGDRTAICYGAYGGALALSSLVSALYHEVRHAGIKAALRVADHCAVYVLIAGTYTPVMLVGIGGGWGWSIFGVVWGVALLGIITKGVFPGRFEGVGVALYLALGWIGLIALEPLIAHLNWPALALFGAGGLLYSVGAVFHVKGRFAFHNLVWHLFVMAGAAAHYFAIIYFVRPLVLAE